MKLLAALLLFVAYVPAFAIPTEAITDRWTEVTSDDKIGIYVDINSIKRDGDLVTMTSLQDYVGGKFLAGTTIGSIVGVEVYDCVNSKAKVLSLSVYPGNMGTGTMIIVDDRLKPWNPVVAESRGDELFKVACMKMHAYDKDQIEYK